MWSIFTSTSFFSPHCLMYVPSSQGSYTGMKCDHCRIFSSPASCLFANLSGPWNPKALSASPPNMLTANAAAVPLLMRSPRESVESVRSTSSAVSVTPFLLSPLDSAERPSCEAFDETIQECVVEKRQGNRREQCGRHKRLPEEDVSSDQVVGDTRRHRALVARRYECEGVDELVHAEGEREDDHREDSRQRDRQNDPVERFQPGRAVDECCLLELRRNRLEEAHQKPCREGHRERGVHDDERQERILEVELCDEPRERQEEER